MNEVFNGDTIFCIDVSKSADIGLVSKTQVLFILNKPVIPGELSFFDNGVLPVIKPAIFFT